MTLVALRFENCVRSLRFGNFERSMEGTLGGIVSVHVRHGRSPTLLISHLVRPLLVGNGGHLGLDLRCFPLDGHGGFDEENEDVDKLQESLVREDENAS